MSKIWKGKENPTFHIDERVEPTRSTSLPGKLASFMERLCSRIRTSGEFVAPGRS